MTDEASRNEFEQKLRQAAEAFEVPPSPKVWDGVRRELHGSRRRALAGWAAAAVLLLALGLYGGLHFYGPRRQGTLVARQAATVPRSQPHPASVPAPPGPGITAASETPAAASRPAGDGSPAPSSSRSSSASSPAGSSLAALSTPVSAPVSFSSGIAASLPLLEGLDLIIPGAPTYRPALSGEANFPGAGTSQAPQAPGAPAALPKEAPPGHMHRVSWTAYLTPAIGYRQFSTDRGHHGSPTLSDPVQSSSFYFLAARRIEKVTYRHRPDWNWSAGVGVSYPLSAKWSLESGLEMTKTGYRVQVYDASPAYVQAYNAVPVSASNDRANSGLMSYGSNAATSGPTYYHIRYLSAEIPLEIHRNFGNPDRVSLDVGAGPALSFLAESRSLIFAPSSGRYYANKHELSKTRAGLRLETGVLVPVARHIRLSAGPALEYQLTSSYRQEEPVQEHPYYVGLQLGLRWKR